MSFLPKTSALRSAGKSSDHSDLYGLMIALPLTLAGTAFLTFLLDVGSRVGF
jgi:hypothetical protein